MDEYANNLQVTVQVLGALQTNGYFLTHALTCETIIVDPADQLSLIQEKCASGKLRPVAVLLTHGHFDHVMAAAGVKETFDIPIYAGAAEKTLLTDARLNLATMVRKEIRLAVDHWLHDGDIITLAGFQIKVIGTPGHTAGSLCFYFAHEGVCISGDTLFSGSIGRTDFPTGNFTEIARSIRTKLFALPDETAVYPGHGEKTTIGYEKRHNMILNM